MNRRTWNFFSAGHLNFGWNAIDNLGRMIRKRSVERLFIVTDPQLIEAGLLDRVRKPLLEEGIQLDVFEDGRPEPDIQTAALAIDQANVFNPDAVLGLGGGSNMDLAKITSAVVAHGGNPNQYFGFDQIPGPVLPIICVPTTAGTGSEVSHAAVLTDTENATKVSTLSQWLRPALAVVDPELTISCPPRATADSGIDALTHAIEACTAVPFSEVDLPPEQASPYDGSQPMGEILCEKAVRLIGRHLAEVFENPENRRAREGMCLAATLAGLAFSNCAVSLVHGLEYPLGAELHCSHGAGNGLLLPYVMEYNLPSCADKMGAIAEWLGADVEGLSSEEAGLKAVERVREIRGRIGIPDRLRDIGARQSQLEGFAEKSFQIKRLMDLNPRTPTLADLVELLKRAF